MNNSDLKNWFQNVVSALVSHPQSVEITETSDEEGTLFLVKVDNEDIGKVIGRQGSIADSLRIILRSAGRLSDLRVSMKVESPNSRFQVR